MNSAFDTTYVVGLMFTPDQKNVLLIHKLRPKWQAGDYNGVGGKVEPGESPIDAMIREFEEETGALTSAEDWIKSVIYTGLDTKKSYQVHFFKAFTLRVYEAYSKTDEPVFRFHIDSLPKNMVYCLNWIIPLCLDMNIAQDLPILVFEPNPDM